MRENGSLNFYRNLMKRDVPVDRNKTAPKCRQCCYYHPDFKYRKCLFSTCPYGKQDKDIFRPSAWNAFGTKDREGADYRACAAFGPIYGRK